MHAVLYFPRSARCIQVLHKLHNTAAAGIRRGLLEAGADSSRIIEGETQGIYTAHWRAFASHGELPLQLRVGEADTLGTSNDPYAAAPMNEPAKVLLVHALSGDHFNTTGWGHCRGIL